MTASKKQRTASREYLTIVNEIEYGTAIDIRTGNEVRTGIVRVVGDGDDEHRDRIHRILMAWATDDLSLTGEDCKYLNEMGEKYYASMPSPRLDSNFKNVTPPHRLGDDVRTGYGELHKDIMAWIKDGNDIWRPRQCKLPDCDRWFLIATKGSKGNVCELHTNENKEAQKRYEASPKRLNRRNEKNQKKAKQKREEKEARRQENVGRHLQASDEDMGGKI